MSGRLWALAILLGLIAAAWLFSGPILREIGSLLVKDGPPAKADIIVVLAGDYRGNRVLKGAQLAKDSFAPAVLVSNSGSDYDRSESELATEFAVRRGYSPASLIVTTWDVSSTLGEAKAVIAELRNRSAHKAIIVTSSWHTARAGRIYRRLAPDLTFYLVGSDDPNWHSGNWWTDREGRKTFFMETVKTVANYLGI